MSVHKKNNSTMTITEENINVITTAIVYIQKNDQLSTGGVHLLFVLQLLKWKKKNQPTLSWDKRQVGELVSLVL